MIAATPPGKPASTENVTVPFDRVVGMVRHLTHEIRNGLNTLDLQAAFLQELVTDAEASPEVKRFRTMIGSTNKALQALSATFWLGQANPVTYSAKIFAEDFRNRIASVLPEGGMREIAWTETLGKESVSLDIEMIFRAFSEFLKNAFNFREKGGKIDVRILTEEGRFILELKETKSELASPPETWGCEPMVSTRRGGFGMGLFHARRILDAHHGTVDFAFDPAGQLLTTRLSLPLADG